MAYINFKESTPNRQPFGGMMVDVIQTPREIPIAKRPGFLGRIINVLRNIMRGMRVTVRYFADGKTVVTQQYPENRKTLKMFDRYRAQLKFIYNEEGEHNCTGCVICAQVCPNESIIIKPMKGVITKKTEIDQYIWRWDTCTFCNACVLACPHGAIEFGGNFESSVFDRRLLVYNLNSYAGPPAKVLKKMSDEDKQASVFPRKTFSGGTPLEGVAMPGIHALETPQKGSDHAA